MIDKKSFPKTWGNPEIIHYLCAIIGLLTVLRDAIKDAALKSVEAGQQPATTAMPPCDRWRDVFPMRSSTAARVGRTAAVADAVLAASHIGLTK